MTLICKVTFVCTFAFDNFYALLQLIAIVCTIAIDYFCIQWWNYRQLLHEHIFSTIDSLSCTVRLMTFVCTIANLQPFFGLLQLKNILCCKSNIKITCGIVYNNIHNTKTTLELLYNLLRLILLLVELLSQLKIQNMTTEWSNDLSYNNSNNTYTLPTA